MEREIILGIKGKNFVMLASDTMQGKSLIYMKDDQRKIHPLSNHSVMAVVGDGGDSMQLSDFIASNLKLYRVQHGYYLSPQAAAYFARKTLSQYSKNHIRFKVSALIAGFDKKSGPELHYIDSIGCSHIVRYAGHGCGSKICLSIFQTEWKPDMNRMQCYETLKRCVTEIHRRSVVNLRNFDVIMVDQTGANRMTTIYPSNSITRKRKRT